MKNISIIVAVAENFAIGKDNQLLCYVPGDLKRFKELTTGHTVLMGRHTYESLPNKPLPNRTNIVITGNKFLQFEGCKMATSVEEALNNCPDDDEIFIMGGGKVYSEFLPYTNKLYLTIIHQQFEADTFFPEIDLKLWKETSRQDFPVSEKNSFSYSFVNYEKK